MKHFFVVSEISNPAIKLGFLEDLGTKKVGLGGH